MISLNDDEIAALRGGSVREGVFFRLDWEPTPIRLWLGIGNCRVASNALDEDGATYRGLGELVEVPILQQLINGVAARVTFRVSGISEQTSVVASTELPDVQGRLCAMGICLFGSDWRQLGVPKWLFRGIADFSTVNQEAGEDGGFVRSIELSVGTLFTGRRRRGLSYLTDRDQQLRHPGDKICERTVLYSSEVTKVWPRFEP